MNELPTISEHKQIGGNSPAKRASAKSKTMLPDARTMMHMNHKRTLALDSSTNKRLKGNPTAGAYANGGDAMQSAYAMKLNEAMHQQQQQQQREHQLQQQQKSPHLLQHLMAPTPQKSRKHNGPGAGRPGADGALIDAQWNRCLGGDAHPDKAKMQSSDSVLKNLLVSGCDISAGYVCHVPVRLKKLAKA